MQMAPPPIFLHEIKLTVKGVIQFYVTELDLFTTLQGFPWVLDTTHLPIPSLPLFQPDRSAQARQRGENAVTKWPTRPPPALLDFD